ncbi:MAG: DUF393 domain-containing protein, partial [Ignavibacteriae bacterium]|nr:DUF393 domain-containing protein [Ignavibacteriota bacterium]
MDDYISNKPIILFDGICNLCNSVVKYVIKNDKNKVFLFCSLQSDKARDILISLNYKITNPESIIL